MKSELKNKNIAIIGLGQIGCSIAMGLKHKTNKIYGFDIDESVIKQVVSYEIIDSEISIKKATFFADIIFICTPVDKTLIIAKQILELSKPNNVVIDVGSTKKSICKALKNHKNRDRFIAAHPMAGSSIKGLEGARLNMFSGKTTFICENQLSNPVALNSAIDIFKELGTNIEFIKPAKHDQLVGLVSHLPQIIAYTICNTVGKVATNKNECMLAASSGFDSASRLAKSPSSIWLPIVVENHINIVNYIKEMINQLQTIQKHINYCNTKEIATFFDNANKIRELFEANTSK